MICRANISKRMTTILFVCLVSIFSGLPAEADFMLCFGSDGHIDLSSVACSKAAPTKLQIPRNLFEGKERHGDCLDLDLFCGAFYREPLGSAGVSSFRSLKKKLSSPVGTIISSFSPDDARFAYAFSHLSQEIFLPSKFVYLGTVVLLI